MGFRARTGEFLQLPQGRFLALLLLLFSHFAIVGCITSAELNEIRRTERQRSADLMAATLRELAEERNYLNRVFVDSTEFTQTSLVNFIRLAGGLPVLQGEADTVLSLEISPQRCPNPRERTDWRATATLKDIHGPGGAVIVLMLGEARAFTSGNCSDTQRLLADAALRNLR